MQVLEALQGLADQITGQHLGADEPVMSAGLDSLGAIELQNAVVALYGVRLPATVAFDYPTLGVWKAFSISRLADPGFL